MENDKNNKKIKLNGIQLPFIKLKVDNKLTFKRGFEKRRDEIENQTHKLISNCENLKIKYIKKKEINNDYLLSEYQQNTSNGNQANISNYYLRPKSLKSNSNINKNINTSINNNKFTNNKNINKIFEIDYLFLKEKYKRCITKLKNRENSAINFSVKNNSLTFNYKDNYNYNRFLSPKNNTRKIQILRINKNEDIKNDINNDHNDLFITNIWNFTDSDNIKFYIQRKKENLSKLNLILKDTNDKIDEIGTKIKTFEINSRKNSPKSLRNLNNILKKDINKEKNEINYKKIFNTGKKDNIIRYVKINLNKNKLINKNNNFSFIKKSTADLIKYYQSLQLMPDDYFYKERKRIISKYPLIQREADLLIKNNENSKISHKAKYLADNNVNKIYNLIDNNIILYNKVLNNQK